MEAKDDLQDPWETRPTMQEPRAHNKVIFEQGFHAILPMQAVHVKCQLPMYCKSANE